MKIKPIAVLIADVHYHVNTITVADRCTRMAIDEAHRRRVPLVIDGDLLDQKPIIRGEVAKVLIETLKYAKLLGVEVIVVVGNHDKINEKGADHSLEFIRPWANVIDSTRSASQLDAPRIAFIPYQSSVEAFREQLAMIQPGWLIIMHQGVQGAFMGDYSTDKSSIDPAELAAYAVISGHYHRAQSIATSTGNPNYFGVGTLNYIGSPYSTTFAEANDGLKGFQILYSDWSMKQVPTGQRKHVILEMDAAGILDGELTRMDALVEPGDLVWIKAAGSCADLDRLKKKDMLAQLPAVGFLKFDKISTDTVRAILPTAKMTGPQMLDALIDRSDEPAARKKKLKSVWREAMS